MRRGAALPMVLLSLGLVAALTVGGSFATRRYHADGRRVESAQAIEPALESALVLALSAMDSTMLDSIEIGETVASRPSVGGLRSQVVTATWVTRIGPGEFALVGEASDGRKPLQIQRLMLVAVRDSAGLRPIPMRPWTRLP